MSSSDDRRRAVDVDIECVSYSPVGDMLDSTIEVQTEFLESREIEDLFRYYVEEVCVQGDTSKVTFGNFTSSSEIKSVLDELRQVAPEESEFRPRVVELAQRLNRVMTSNANDGVLFVARATLSGGNIAGGPVEVIAVLKLDTEEDQRLVLSDDGIDAVNESDAFPPRERLQKGAVYPKSGIPPQDMPGEMKIFQNSYSKYFEQYFEIESSIPSSTKQGRKSLRFMEDKVEEELGRKIK
jgi:phage FluMu protein gp41